MVNARCVLSDATTVGIVHRILGIVQGLYAVLRYLTGERLDHSRAYPDGGVADRRNGGDRHLVHPDYTRTPG